MVGRAGISEEPFRPNLYNSDGEIILLMIYVDDIIITSRSTFTHRGKIQRRGERCMRGRLAQVHFSKHANSAERANDLPGTQSSMREPSMWSFIATSSDNWSKTGAQFCSTIQQRITLQTLLPSFWVLFHMLHFGTSLV